VNTLKGLGKRQQTTETFCVSSESENATSLQLISLLNFYCTLYTTINYTVSNNYIICKSRKVAC